jgi:hypothetical protein
MESGSKQVYSYLKVDLKSKLVRKNKCHYILIKGTIHQEDITNVNIYAQNVGAPSFMKQILLDIKG